jgi:hypothetical protein
VTACVCGSLNEYHAPHCLDQRATLRDVVLGLERIELALDRIVAMLTNVVSDTG